jgi:hypothetical protein
MKFGISFLYCPAGAALHAFRYDLFPGAELPGSMMRQEMRPKAMNMLNFKKIHFSDLMPNGVSRAIVSQSEKIKTGFKEEMQRLIKIAAGLNAETISMDFGIENAIGGDNYRRELIRLLRAIEPDLYRHEIKLLLPVRIPLLPEMATDDYLSLKRELMCPDIHFLVDVHPHELVGKSVSLHELFHWLKFNIQTVRFFYEPETGNRLVEKLLTPWLDCLKNNFFEGCALLCPASSKIDVFETEIAYLEKLAGELNKSGKSGA